MAQQKTKEILTGKLSAELVDAFSDATEKELTKTKLSKKDILRFRLSVDSAMCAWLETLGEGAECRLEFCKRFGRTTITVACKGAQCDPRQQDEDFGKLENSSLLQSLGLSAGYSYENGVNYLKLMPGSGAVLQLAPILLALAFGAGLAIALKAISPSFASSFNAQVVDPVFSTLMGVLRAIASPLIFLAVLSGIYGIGNIATLGTIGKKLMGRFILMTFVALGVNSVLLLPMVKLDVFGYVAGSDSVKEFLNLVLQFIPSDIISPFLDGNMLQIITISVACGIVMLVLGERVSELTKIIDQIYAVVQLLMEAIGRLVPLFIFTSVFSFVLSDNSVEAKNILLPVVGIVGTFIITALIVYPLTLKIKYRIGYVPLMKKLLPTFMIAFTTASSAAAFASNIETCEKSLGISDKITRFGVPLGQVVYMPLAAAEYFSVSLIMANMWGVKISLMWCITAIFVAGVLAIATPPIPGGSISVFTALFLQLSIPAAALPIAIGVDLLIDYISTAGNIMCLQEELIICADKLDLLDRKKLLTEK